jgi:hypothetical protein
MYQFVVGGVERMVEKVPINRILGSQANQENRSAKLVLLCKDAMKAASISLRIILR